MAFWEPFKASDTVTMQAFNDKVGGGFSAVESALSTISMPTLLKEVNLTTPATQQDIDLSDINKDTYKLIEVKFNLTLQNNSDNVSTTVGFRVNNDSSYVYVANDQAGYDNFSIATFSGHGYTAYVDGTIYLFSKHDKHTAVLNTILQDNTGGNNTKFSYGNSIGYMGSGTNALYNDLSSINFGLYANYTNINITSLTAKVYGYTENNLFMI